MDARVGKAIIALQKYPEKIQIGRNSNFALYAKIDAPRTAAGEAPLSAHRGVMQTSRIRPVTTSEQISSLHSVKDPNRAGIFCDTDIFANVQTAANPVLSATLDASSLIEFYNSTKKQQSTKTEDLKLGDIILYAVSRTLPVFPGLNSHYIGNSVVNISDINLGFGCDTDKGLLVPVIFKANSLSMLSLSKAARQLSEEARSYRINHEKLTGGSFTVLNFGAYGVNFTPTVTPPQVGILNVNTIETKVRDMEGELKPYPSLSLSMSFNPRAVDGVIAARFLSSLCRNLENLVMLILQ